MIKNRSTRNGGGVAILVHKCLQFSMLVLPQFSSLEAIDVSVSWPNTNSIEFFPLCPRENVLKKNLT